LALRLGILLLLSLLHVFPRSEAQTLPDCPWPVDALISASATYTLTGNCKVTDMMQMTGSDTVVTINGGGYSVDASALRTSKSIIVAFPGAELIVNNITFIGGGGRNRAALHLAGSATISNTTFRDAYRNAISASTGGSASNYSYTLTNILVEDVQGIYFHYGETGMAVAAHHNAAFTINNMVVRNSVGGNAALSIFPNGGASITMTGCFTADGVWPQAFYGNVDTAGITGECSGSIGNGGTAERQYPPATAAACGMPLGGFVESDASYTLSADCEMSGTLFLVNGATVTIDGNGHTLSRDSGTILATAADLTIRNMALSNVGGRPIFGLQRNNQLRAERVTFRENGSPIVLADQSATFENARFESNVYAGAATTSQASVLRILHGSAVTIRNAVVSDNSGGQSSIYVGAANVFGDSPSLNLEGCLTLENNSPADIIDGGSYLTDNSTGPCENPDDIGAPDPLIFTPSAVANPAPSASGTSAKHSWSPPSEICDGKPGAVPVGAVACIFREEERLDVYGLDEHSQGFFMVSATQAQIDAACAGLVASSPDGRAAIFAEANGDVIVSVNPDYENKVLHARLDGGVHGSVISITTTFGPPPGLVGPPGALACARALQSCVVRTNYIVNFRDAPAGNIQRFVDIWGIPNDGMLPYDVTLTALERTSDWFKVDYHGTQGWISADYVEPQGSCG